jgi:uncharacterized protein (DUF2252 family)
MARVAALRETVRSFRASRLTPRRAFFESVLMAIAFASRGPACTEEGNPDQSGPACNDSVTADTRSLSKAVPVTRVRLPISPEERAPLLDARREAKMASSAHAYVRGSTRRFYEWLASSRGRSLPKGPSIWIGGDCHVGNLGPVAAKDGGIAIDLRDLDQTVIGSPAHDVARLSLSMAMAVRASALPGAVTGRVLESIAHGYEVALEARASRRDFVLEKPPAQVLSVLREARSRSRGQLFAERIGKDAGVIPMGKRFWPLTSGERKDVERLIGTAKVKKLLTSLASRDNHSAAKLVDAAFWVKGCSSLGSWRAAALVQVGGGRAKSLALIDIKEALPALAPHSRDADVPKHHGERVVAGARALSPSLGERMAPATVVGKDVFVRELLPQDLKFELESLAEAEALAIGRYLASVVGVAHARQLDPSECADWLEGFRKGSAEHLATPAWLWAAVVDLVALHEGSYLEYCREHGSAVADASARAFGGIVSHHVTGD